MPLHMENVEELDHQVEPPPSVTTPQTAVAELIRLATSAPAEPPRLSVKQMIKLFCALSPAEQVAFGRRIGVDYVWRPRDRKARIGGAR